MKRSRDSSIRGLLDANVLGEKRLEWRGSSGNFPDELRNLLNMATILIVDDELLIRWAIAQTLEAAGFEVREAGTAREALECLEKGEDVGVVLLDLKLPDSSDLGLLRTLRQRAPGSQVILMTAHGSAEVLEEAMRAGAFLALGKPFDMQYMVDRVRAAIAA